MSKHKSIYGIIGYPVHHSLSPLLHNTAFQALAVNAEYKLFPLREEELSNFFAELHEKKNHIFGLNVTVPYKETVVSYMDHMSPFALKVGAVNTIVISEDRKLTGFNTDGPGFLTHLTELKFDTRGKRIAILGAGGTARAIVAGLCLIKERPERIKIYNRSRENLNQLISDLGHRIDVSIVEPVDTVDDLNIELADLLVNTTPVGMQATDLPLVDAGHLHSNMLVYDVIYNPEETKLLHMAKTKGAKAANGLGMLFYQGILAFQHWAGTELEPAVKSKMRESLRKGIQK